uniref:U1-type domain-containing protein n=1 Tax=Clastoptera arizonana TaxID=38151 RepID=A0A1B6DB28_9HEMI
MCELCQVQIQYSDISNLISEFSNHLTSSLHTNNFEKCQHLKQSKSISEVSENFNVVQPSENVNSENSVDNSSIIECNTIIDSPIDNFTTLTDKKNIQEDFKPQSHMKNGGIKKATSLKESKDQNILEIGTNINYFKDMDNLETLSAYLSSTEIEIPQVIEENRDYILNKKDNFFCGLCDVSIIICEDIAKVLKQMCLHFNGKSHKKVYTNSLKAHEEFKNDGSNIEKLGFECLKSIFGSHAIPEIFEINKLFLRKNKDNYVCKLCQVQIQYSDNQNLVSEISNHLTSSIHINNFEKCKHSNQSKLNSEVSKNLSVIQQPNAVLTIVNSNSSFNMEYTGSKIRVDSPINNDCTLDDPIIQEDFKPQFHKNHGRLVPDIPNLTYNVVKNSLEKLSEYLGSTEIPHVIEENNDFILNKEGKFVCGLCEVEIVICEDAATVLKEMCLHFKGKKHTKMFNTFFKTKALEESKNQNSTVEKPDFECLKSIFGLDPIPEIFKINMLYLVKNKDGYMCKLCQVPIQYCDSSSLVSMFSNHLMSSVHIINVEKCKNCVELKSNSKVSEEWNVIELPNDIANIDKISTIDSRPAKIKTNVPTDDDNTLIPPEDFKSEVSVKFNVVQLKEDVNFANSSIFECATCDIKFNTPVDNDGTIALFEIQENLKSESHVKNEVIKKASCSKETDYQKLQKIVTGMHNLSLNNIDNNLGTLNAYLGSTEVPQIIEENMVFILNIEGNFFCGLCNVRLVIYDDITTTLKQMCSHFYGKCHTKQYISSLKTKIPRNINSGIQSEFLDSLKEYFDTDNIPEEIICNKKFVKVNDNNFVCVLCNVEFNKASKTSNNIKQVTDHLIGAKHLKNISKSAIVLDNDFQQLKNLFGSNPVPEIIQLNKNYIVRYGNHFECKLCQRQIHILGLYDYDKLINMFSQHLTSKNHVKNFKQVNISKQDTPNLKTPNSLFNEDLKKLINLLEPNKIPDVLIENQEYIKKTDQHFTCTLCSAQLSVSSNASGTVNTFAKHLSSIRHCKKVDLLKTKQQPNAMKTHSIGYKK